MLPGVKFLRAAALVLLLLGICFVARGQSKEIIGYYPSWNWRSSVHAMSPAQIPYTKLTIIDYAFFYPRVDGTIRGRDSSGDALYLGGNSGGSLIALAHNDGVKVMLSVGGWADSDTFPAVASGVESRRAFAHSCVEQVRRYGFDGIDIDWEYPCYADHKGTPDDKANFTKLLQETRDSLDAFGEANGRRMLLTAAFPAVEKLTVSYEMAEAAKLLDMLNIMTYDLCGSWDTLSGYNAPLYAPNASDTLRNVDAAFRLFTRTYGIPAEKINLGVPFYGHTFSGCVAPYTRHTGADTVHFPPDGCQYYDIAAVADKFKHVWDETAKVPYLASSAWNTFISYDDEQSVSEKARYVIDHHACGLIIWEITGDRLADGSTPLLNSIHSTFAEAQKR